MNRFRRCHWNKMICLVATTAIAFGQSIRPAVSTDPDGDAARPVQQQNGRADSVAANAPDTPQPNETQNKLFNLPKALLHDQIGMWTSPAKARFSDASWLVPLGGLTAGLLVTDSDVSRHLSNEPSTLTRYRHLSEYGVYSMAGGAAGAYFLGVVTHNEHQRETGFLSGEAAIDGLIAVEALKVASQRQRPDQGNGSGQFWNGGSSFPSEHSAAAWAIAGIVAHEYPGPLMKFLAYGMAGVVSASRITAKQHFPSDVLIGAAIGYLTSQYVYRQHHNPELPGGTWELPAFRPDGPSHWQAKYMGSPYVPLDSWIYPALDRLTAMGDIESSFLGMRPWTRMECARLVEEAQDRIAPDAENGESEAARLHHDLQKEFAGEINLLGGGDNAALRLESVYARSTEIAGRPLTNGYIFGQTIINDYGRPYEQGFNNVSGASGWGEMGPFMGYVRGEFQHAPSAPALPDSALAAIQNGEFLPTPPPATPTLGVDRMDAIDAYVGMNLGNWQVSFGKQEQWWGPDASGPMIFSNNAEPVMMFKVDRVSPFKLPSVFGLMGPIRLGFFLGQLQGHHFLAGAKGLIGNYATPVNPQPMILGYKLSFKPTPNVEFGLSVTRIFAGEGVPFTLHSFLLALYGRNGPPGTARDPGDGRSGFDLSYRLPGLRKWATFYADGFSEDEISPLAYWDRSAWVSGLYFPQLPKIPKLDLRVEGGYTDLPIGGDVGPGFFYFNFRYRNGYTNWGNLMGNWMGRAGQGAQAWTTYWFTPRNNLQFNFRHQKVSHEFIPSGGTLTDVSAKANFWARSTFSVSAAVQYEVWNFPVIAPTRQSNVTSSVQLTFWPKGLSRKNSSD